VEGRKVFMGVAQILLNKLDLSAIVIDWYKLYGVSSIVTVPPKMLPPAILPAITL